MRVTVTARVVRQCSSHRWLVPEWKGTLSWPHRCFPNRQYQSDPRRAISAASLEGYGLTTAKIFYRLPDHPSLLQTYVWQEYDLFPKFPALNRFLAFWLEKLEGPLHSVTVAHSRLIRPAEIRAVNGEFRLH